MNRPSYCDCGRPFVHTVCPDCDPGWIDRTTTVLGFVQATGRGLAVDVDPPKSYHPGTSERFEVRNYHGEWGLRDGWPSDSPWTAGRGPTEGAALADFWASYLAECDFRMWFDPPDPLLPAALRAKIEAAT